MAGTETAGLGGEISQTGETGELQQELQVSEGLYERDHFQTKAVRSSQYIIYLLYSVVPSPGSRQQSEANTKSQESSVLYFLPTPLNSSQHFQNVRNIVQ